MTVTDVFSERLFAGKHVFVTGGGSGINLGIAKNFAALGAAVSICGRSQERLDGAAAELRALGGQVFVRSADVRDYAALEAAISDAGQALGPMSTLVCGAAGNFPAPAEAISPNGFKAVVDIDLIVFVSAGQAYSPHALQAHVGAAKAGVDMLMKDLALDWGKYGIRSNSVVPGPIDDTEGMRRLAPLAGSKEQFMKAVPLGRLGHVDDIGAVAVFLASPLASYVTGTVLVADGGMNLLGSGIWLSVAMGGGQAVKTAERMERT